MERHRDGVVHSLSQAHDMLGSAPTPLLRRAELVAGVVGAGVGRTLAPLVRLSYGQDRTLNSR